MKGDIMERKRQQCPRCKSYSLKFGLFGNECKDCGLKQYLTLWNAGKEYKEQATFKNIINKLLIIGAILIVAFYFVFPIIFLNFDFMGYLRTGELVSFIIGLTLIYAIYMIIGGKYVFAFPKQPGQKQPKQQRPQQQYKQLHQPSSQKHQQQGPPKTLQYKLCNICKQDKPKQDVKAYNFKGRNLNICSDCIREIK